MNSTQIFYTLTVSIPRSAFGHEIPYTYTRINTHTHTPFPRVFLVRLYRSFFCLFERQIIAALSERMKENLEATRVNKQQKNENRCENERVRMRVRRVEIKRIGDKE